MIKQHYVVDIPGALVVAFATSLLFLREMDRGPAAAAAVRAHR
jgi:hypothetical protein